MIVLKFVRVDDRLAGVLSEFPVHGTSMINTSTLISPDNKGCAADYWEPSVSGNRAFVTAFAQTNTGDLSPNLNLKPGSVLYDDPVKNTREIDYQQFQKADEIARQAGEDIHGPLDIRFQYVNFSQLIMRPQYADSRARQFCYGQHRERPGPSRVARK